MDEYMNDVSFDIGKVLTQFAAGVTYLSDQKKIEDKAEENRTFFIDYNIEDDYRLIELSKKIIQMNADEANTPESELKPIYLWIHSYGGDLYQAQYFCDLIQASRIPIVTVAMGSAMSAAFLIFICGKRRYAFQNSQLLVHEGSTKFEGSATEVEEAMKNYMKTIDNMKDIILAKTEIPEKIFNKNRKKDWYLTTQELVDYKIADHIVEKFEDIK